MTKIHKYNASRSKIWKKNFISVLLPASRSRFKLNRVFSFTYFNLFNTKLQYAFQIFTATIHWANIWICIVVNYSASWAEEHSSAATSHGQQTYWDFSHIEIWLSCWVDFSQQPLIGELFLAGRLVGLLIWSETNLIFIRSPKKVDKQVLPNCRRKELNSNVGAIKVSDTDIMYIVLFKRLPG